MTTWHLITVSYNSAQALNEHWADFRPSDRVYWTVVDNASTDDSVKVARQLGAQVIKLPRNVGFGAANNVGADSRISDNVAFVNPDVRVDLDSLIAASDYLKAHPRTVMAPQLIHSTGTVQANGRGLPTLGSKLFNRIFPHRKSPYIMIASPSQQRYVCWAMGAAILMASPVFQSLRWDERFFVYYEDHDFGLRAWKAGLEVILNGDVRWTHAWARETSRLSVAPWKRELSSLLTFFTIYPHLLLPRRIAARWHAERSAWGSLAHPSESHVTNR